MRSIKAFGLCLVLLFVITSCEAMAEFFGLNNDNQELNTHADDHSYIPVELHGIWGSSNITIEINADSLSKKENGQSIEYSIVDVSLDDSWFIMKQSEHEEFGRVEWVFDSEKLSLTSYEKCPIIAEAKLITTIESVSVYAKIPDDEPPSNVSNLQFKEWDGSVFLIWQDPADSDLAEILIQIEDGESSIINPGMENFEILNLTNGVTYSLNIATKNSSGNMSDAATYVITPTAYLDNIIVYGTQSCWYTNNLKKSLKNNGISFTYKGIDEFDSVQYEMWDIVKESDWYTGGSVKLPIGIINGVVLERATIEDVIDRIDKGNGTIPISDTGYVEYEISNELGDAILSFQNRTNGNPYEFIGAFPAESRFPNRITNRVLNGVYNNVVALPTSTDYLNTKFPFSDIVISENNKTDLGSLGYSLSIPHSSTSFVNSEIINSEHNVLYSIRKDSLWVLRDNYSWSKRIINGAGYLNELKIDPINQYLYTIDQENRILFIVDVNPMNLTYNEVINSISLIHAQPVKLDFEEGDHMVYIACNGGAKVVGVNVDNSQIELELDTKGFTQDVVIDSLNKKIYSSVLSFDGSPNYRLHEFNIDDSSMNYGMIENTFFFNKQDGCFNQVLYNNTIISGSRSVIEYVNIENGESGVLHVNNTYSDLLLIDDVLFFLSRDLVTKVYSINSYNMITNQILHSTELSNDIFYHLTYDCNNQQLLLSTNYKVMSLSINLETGLFE